MKNKDKYTPIVVGVVIALLGILTGLYFAENAREQLANLSSSEAPEAASDLQSADSIEPDADALITPMPLEPLDPITVDEMPAIEPEEEPATTDAEVEPVVTEEEPQPEIDDMEEVDDFEEVDPEEEMRQAETPVNDQPTGEAEE